jgi:hypothetical protein
MWISEPVGKLPGDEIEQAVNRTHATLCQAKEVGVC